MKTLKTYLIAVFTVTAITANAQLKVDNLGRVGISTGTSAISGQFQVGDATNYNSSIMAIGSDFRIGSYNSGTQYAFVSARDFSTRSIGMVLRVQTSGSLYNAVTISPNGYFGIGNSITPMYNLDVVGNINASTSVRAAGVILTSDERLKDNIKNLPVSSVALLMNLQGVTYRLKPNGAALLSSSLNSATDTKGDTVTFQNIGQNNDTSFLNRNHMGFLAQDVQKVFPELVYADRDGILSVDYIGLVPILVESIKQLSINHVKDSLNFIGLQNKLIDLENQINQCCENYSTLKSVQNKVVILESPLAMPALYQNTPNPFNQNTTIAYFLPEYVKVANLYIYNMQGVQIKVLPISDRTNGNIVINGNELNPGMYLYSLIADGKEVDTKRMILTE
jgi:hypothetical protein